MVNTEGRDASRKASYIKLELEIGVRLGERDISRETLFYNMRGGYNRYDILLRRSPVYFPSFILPALIFKTHFSTDITFDRKEELYPA